MKKRTVRFTLFLVVISFTLLVPVTGCGTPATTEKLSVLTVQSTPLIKNPPPEDDELLIPVSGDGEWQRIKTFTGTANDTTTQFPISGTGWRICWAIDTLYPEYATFDIFVYRKGVQTTFEQKFSHTGTDNAGTVLIEQGAGTYYMKVIATNLYRWSIAVEDYAVTQPDSPVKITHIYYKGRGLLESIKINEDIVEADEYIEISNVSDMPQSISGWRLKNITRGFPVFTFPSYYPYCYGFNSDATDYTIAPLIPCVLEPYHSIRVYTGEVHYQSGGFCYYFLPGDIWNNIEPDTAVLYSSYNKEVSRRTYIIAPLSETD
jgi:hypothetical protein